MDKIKIKEKNNLYLKEYQEWLEKKGVCEEFQLEILASLKIFLNDYLCDQEEMNMMEGLIASYSFLSDWYIKYEKNITEEKMLKMIKNIKEFYQCMQELNYINKKDYETFSNFIDSCCNDFLNQLNYSIYN